MCTFFPLWSVFLKTPSIHTTGESSYPTAWILALLLASVRNCAFPQPSSRTFIPSLSSRASRIFLIDCFGVGTNGTLSMKTRIDGMVRARITIFTPKKIFSRDMFDRSSTMILVFFSSSVHCFILAFYVFCVKIILVRMIFERECQAIDRENLFFFRLSGR